MQEKFQSSLLENQKIDEHNTTTYNIFESLTKDEANLMKGDDDSES